MTSLHDLDTPALILDRARLARNCEDMLARCRARGVRLRPHMKTLKSVACARLAVDPSHGGIAVSTLAEAKYFADAGFQDIQLALCLPPGRVGRAVAVLEADPRFSVFVDSVSAAEAIAASDAPLGVWIEIDCGEHRTGVAPDDAALLRIAERLQASRAVLRGVATHGGHSYGCRSVAEIRAVAEQERAAAVAAAERLRSAGHVVAEVSAGSSPTAWHGESAEGLTEIRAGVFMAGDLFQANIGAPEGHGALAVTVLSSVISADPGHGHVVLDAGALALSKDRSTAATPEQDFGYGLVLDLAGRASLGRLVVGAVHQEHGDVSGPDPLPFAQLPVGARVRIAPNHVCMTAAAYACFHVVDGADPRVQEVWPRVQGW